MRTTRHTADDRRYMTHETRAIDDARYRGRIVLDEPKSRYCRCGKTCYVDGFGHRAADYCPRGCDARAEVAR